MCSISLLRLVYSGIVFRQYLQNVSYYSQLTHKYLWVQYGVPMNGQPMPVANGSAGAVANDPLTNHLAGMSKHQLYEVMVQMKVCNMWSYWYLELVAQIRKWWCYWRNVYIWIQTMIQQNQQQARQVLMANPQLTKAIFQVLEVFWHFMMDNIVNTVSLDNLNSFKHFKNSLRWQ